MELELARQREQAHDLLDGLPEEKFLVVRDLLAILAESDADPLARSLANAPLEDEEIDEEEEVAVAESKAWLAKNPGAGTSHQEVLAEFGLTSADADAEHGSSLMTSRSG